MSTESNTERWEPIAGWHGYEVSDQGRIRSWKKCRRTPKQALPRVMKTHTLPTGYIIIKLKDKERKVNHYVHRLVLGAFIGEAPTGAHAAHWDGIRDNNRLSNLRYATPAENSEDKRRHGTLCEGERHYQSQLTSEQARTIYSHPGSTTEAAALFGVSYFIAWHVRAGRTYKSATKDLR